MRSLISLAVLGCLGLGGFSSASAGSYSTDAAQSKLTFVFSQAGAEATGAFKTFTTTLETSADGAPTRLAANVTTKSADTQDKERDGALLGAGLFDVANHPTAVFVATSFARTSADRYEAAGKLTLRGVTKDVKLPLTLKKGAGSTLQLSGETRIKRLDFGVGQGEFKATDVVGNDVTIRYSLVLREVTKVTP